jgi:sugar phosphate permease
VIALFVLVTGVTMVATGLASGFWGAMAWRVLTGVGSGGSNVPVMALLSSWFAPRRRGLASGIAVSGSSLALIAIGLLVPRVLNAYGEEGWRISWYVLGAGTLALAGVGMILLRERPEEKGLRSIGARDATQAVPSDPPDTAPPQARVAPDWRRIYRSGSLWHLALVYVAFGFSYVIYATFFAKYLQAEAGYTKEAAGSLWTVVGWISILCGLIWGAVSDAIGRQYGLALVYGLQAVAFALFALWRAPAGYALSAVFFGLTAWSIPGIVAAACGDCVGARLAPAAFGFVTLFFGLGQALGPSIAGALADRLGSFAPAFLLAAGVALIGSVGSLFLRPQCELKT